MIPIARPTMLILANFIVSALILSGLVSAKDEPQLVEVIADLIAIFIIIVTALASVHRIIHAPHWHLTIRKSNKVKPIDKDKIKIPKY